MEKRRLHFNWALYGIFLLASGYCACIHEPWSDELQAWLIARDLSVAGIWRIMAVEGHFMLWHLCLAPLAKCGLPPEAMVALAWALNAVAGWLLIFKSGLDRWLVAILLFSAPLLYFYPSTARCYALFPPLLFLLAMAFPTRAERPFRYAVLLALIVQVHLYLEGFAAAAFLEFAWALWTAGRRMGQWRTWMALALPVASALAAFAQVVGALWRSSYMDDCAFEQPHFGWLMQLHENLRLFGASWTESFALWTGVALAALLAAFVVLMWRLRARNGALVLAASGLWMAAFALLFWMWIPQRVFLLLYLGIAAVWGLPRGAQRLPAVLLAVLALASYSKGGIWIARDLRLPAADFRGAGNYLSEHYPAGQAVIGYPDNCTQLSAYVPKLVFFNMQNGMQRTYYDASAAAERIPQMPFSDMLAIILERHCPVVLNQYKYQPFLDSLHESYPQIRAKCVYPLRETIYPTDSFAILELSRP